MTRDIFWFVAGVLASLALLVVVVPLLRVRRAPAASRPLQALWVGLAALLSTAGATLGLYLWISAPAAVPDDHAAAGTEAPVAAPTVGAAPPSMEVVTAKLAARLAAQGGTAEEWRLLAQSYEFLGRTEEAANAKARAAQASLSAMPAAMPNVTR